MIAQTSKSIRSGAILIYLGEKSGKFYDKKQRTIINHWLMGQMGYVGYVGNIINSITITLVKVILVRKDILKYLKIYRELDERLSNSNFLAGNNYTIADIATFPWIARHEWHDIGLKKFNNLTNGISKLRIEKQL